MTFQSTFTDYVTNLVCRKEYRKRPRTVLKCKIERVYHRIPIGRCAK